MFDEIFGEFRRIDEKHQRMADEFQKLAVEPCQQRPEVGDRVLVAVGLIHHGMLWERMEFIVEEIGDTAYRVIGNEPRDTYMFGKSRWVHQVLITDVLAKATEPTP